MPIRIGARGSKLSRAQLHIVQTALEKAWPEIQFVTHIFETSGDLDQKSPLPEIGGKGVFTAELEQALTEGTIDLAVHSQKDLPVQNPPGLCLGAILERATPTDALISIFGHTLATLPMGGKVGTSSARRKAQLLALRPDLDIVSIRGNVDTRLKKAASLDAIVLAHAGLERLDLQKHISEEIDSARMLPAPAQGALAVQCRNETEFLTLLKPLHHEDTGKCTQAERAFLQGLGGGCSLPISALAYVEDQTIYLEGQVLNPQGTREIRLTLAGNDPIELGHELAKQALAQGAHELIGE
ncbi:MAG: hydroxymethylbilane synthase [Myxococcota bacterium]